MITNSRFAEFFHLFGIAGSAAKNEEELMWFNRIYWFTVEFMEQAQNKKEFKAHFTLKR